MHNTTKVFGNTSIREIQKKVEELLSNRVYVICVFDADVSVRDEVENKRLAAFLQKYKDNKNPGIAMDLFDLFACKHVSLY